MGSLNIYGASDDLIEVEGDLTEEWNTTRAPEGVDVRVSTGDTVHVRMDGGGSWTASHTVQPTGSQMSLVDRHGPNDHVVTDMDGADQIAVLVTPGPIEWVEVVLPDGALVDPGRVTSAGVYARTPDDGQG